MIQSYDLVNELHEAANLLICDARTSRCYGTEFIVSYSELSFLKCIERNDNAKAGDISQFLGITNGAVAQIAKKLVEKGYLESYRKSENKKEVYYRLTSQGLQACIASDKHNEALNFKINSYLNSLNENEKELISGLFKTIITSIEGKQECYIKLNKPEVKIKDSQKGTRCEKCKTAY